MSLTIVAFAMVSLSTWVRYAVHKFEYSVALSWKVLSFFTLFAHSFMPHFAFHVGFGDLIVLVLLIVRIVHFTLIELFVLCHCLYMPI